jgi:hypothetical protein
MPISLDRKISQLSRKPKESPVAAGAGIDYSHPDPQRAGQFRSLVDPPDAVLESVNWEVIFVDDDSLDGTAERIHEIGLSAQDRNVTRRAK